MICGIDLGSRNVKIVIVDEQKQNIIATKIYETVDFYKKYAIKQEGGLIVDLSSLEIDNISSVVATGYGRNTVNLKNAKVISELKAHVIGAIWQTKLSNFTLLDLGGQDSKVIKVQNSKMVDFQTNDKCAASTGRYLENMAVVLGMSLEKMSSYTESPVELNSTCAIFGESELIERIVEGYSEAELAAGVNYTIFRRIKPMLMSLYSEKLVLVGGVALGNSIGKYIQDELNMKVVVPSKPQINGALGCAVCKNT